MKRVVISAATRRAMHRTRDLAVGLSDPMDKLPAGRWLLRVEDHVFDDLLLRRQPDESAEETIVRVYCTSTGRETH